MTMFEKANWDSDVLGHEAYQEFFFEKSGRKYKKKPVKKKTTHMKQHFTPVDSVNSTEISAKKIKNSEIKANVAKKIKYQNFDISPNAESAEILTISKKKRLKRLKRKLKFQNEDSDSNEKYQNKSRIRNRNGINKIVDNKHDESLKHHIELNSISIDSQKIKVENLKKKRRQKSLKGKFNAIDTIGSSSADVKRILENNTVSSQILESKKRKKDSSISRKDIKEKDKKPDSNKNKPIFTEFDKVTTKNRKFLDRLKSTLNETKQKKPLLSLRQKMMEKLKAARFRFLNEEIYTSDSKEAQKLFQSDPEAFRAYHDGYRQQVKRWPLNPLDNIIKDIRKMSKTVTVADFGCGDARLSRSIPQKVFSFDLIAVNDSVTACDMSKIPLEDGVIDVAVFCLSLMGTNLGDYLKEAHRVIKNNGILKIAEVESRFEDVDKFITDLQKYGFRNTLKDLSHNLFYFLDFKKQSSTINKKLLPKLSLLPCLYKKR